jgi:branched-chain amino acid transport system substrate-binding protein
VVKKFKEKGIDPEGYTLYTYATMQIWSQAAAKAKSTDGKKVAAALHTGTWNTVLGPISFDKKGDITTLDYVFYRWSKDGTYSEMPTEKGS